jgi:DNA polymerase delta subunit 2
MVSGLDIGAESPSDAQIQMLVEYLTGEVSGPEEQVSPSQISRLIIAGNSFASMGASGEHDGQTKKPVRSQIHIVSMIVLIASISQRRYGYDSATFSPHPTINFSALLLDLARTMPVHLLPGSSDPSGTILPQQPFPRAMFGAASAFSTFFCETNPTYIHIASGSEYEPQTESRISISRTLLVNSGQPLNDMFKYLPSPPSTRLSLAESTLRWRHMAPTAPDTLWCHPFFAKEPFVILETPDLYVIGNQPRFQTRMVAGNPNEDGSGDKRCRVVLVPRFAETGVLVLVNLRTLGVKTLRFAVEGMTGGGEMDETGEEAR